MNIGKCSFFLFFFNFLIIKIPALINEKEDLLLESSFYLNLGILIILLLLL